MQARPGFMTDIAREREDRKNHRALVAALLVAVPAMTLAEAVKVDITVKEVEHSEWCMWKNTRVRPGFLHEHAFTGLCAAS